MRKKVWRGLSVGLLAGATLCLAAPALALDFDFAGRFTKDNDVVLLDFTVDLDGTITIFSSSWDDGGFDPILAIWDSTGALVAEQDDGGSRGSTVSNLVSYDYGDWDSFYDVYLTAGNYTASIAQYDNFAVGDNLSYGFDYDDGDENFTFTEGYGRQAYFNGVWIHEGQEDDPRTGNWAFHILNVAAAKQEQRDTTVPEPGTLLLLGTGLIGLAGTARRRTLKI